MAASLTTTDREHLRRALELAELGRGKVSPNPLVGAVIVRDGKVIGEGFHAELGDLHAERAALADCRERGEDPAGATMYVTLEPCAHEGRQPPCTEAVLEAGIGRVVIGADDPSEKAAGRGPGVLRDGGVEVEFAAGEEATAARLLNQPFRKHARTGLPLVTLKLAMSLDGQMETAADDSPWISGPESQALVHHWRAESDAIAVGIGTALADDPLLTARPEVPPDPPRLSFGSHSGSKLNHAAARQPLRVVFDREARLPRESQLVRTVEQSPVLVVASQAADPARLKTLRDAGAETLIADGIGAALSELGRRNITSLFLEGGRTLASAFLEQDAIDQSRTFIAPILLGGGAPRAGGGVGGTSPEEALATGRGGGSPAPTGPARRSALSLDVQHVGADVLISARFKEW